VLEAAPEPSNIVWENLGVTVNERRKRKCIAFICIFIFIACTFLLFTVMKSFSGVNNLKYPPRTDCENINQLFSEDAAGKELYETLATYDKDFAMEKSANGQYKCFCEKYTKVTEVTKADSLCF